MPTIPGVYYASVIPKPDIIRSNSAPVPEPDMQANGEPSAHPAYSRNVRPSGKRSNLPPLNEIGRPRRPSESNGLAIGSIGEALNPIAEISAEGIIIVPENRNTPPPPPVFSELAHLALPPPPPPVAPFGDAAHHSLSSGSGVGTINIVMEDDIDDAHVIEVPPQNHQPSNLSRTPITAPQISPSKNGNVSPPPPPQPAQSYTSPVTTHLPAFPNTTSPTGHRRGRSIDHVSNPLSRIAQRMRSSSRGRVQKPIVEGSGNGIVSGLQQGQRAPYESRGTGAFF